MENTLLLRKITKFFSMKNEYQNFVINRIRQLREERGYTQNKIADILGISDGQMGNIESPKTAHKYTLAHIRQICKAFNVPIEQIFLEDKELKRDRDTIDLLIEKIVKYEQ